ncbi:MAG TPA: glycosyltransferase, partial [Candidatus Syntrophosphaera sp.]|nr:glycosyltransferase [Candidatus Syntrophosphaera sp.]
MAESATRIALLGPAPPFRGGITQFALMLALEYQRQGKEIRMFSFHRQYPQLLFPGAKQTTEFSTFPEIPVERLFTPYQPLTWNKVVHGIQAWKPDIVIVSYFLPWFAPSYTWICQRLRGARLICLAHNVDFHEHWPGADFLSKMLFDRFDRIVLLSQACWQDLLRKFPGPISDKSVTGFHPIYDCYQNPTQPETEIGSSSPTLLFFGLIKAYKGLDVLL